jgi:hypothetical protein
MGEHMAIVATLEVRTGYLLIVCGAVLVAAGVRRAVSNRSSINPRIAVTASALQAVAVIACATAWYDEATSAEVTVVHRADWASAVLLLVGFALMCLALLGRGDAHAATMAVAGSGLAVCGRWMLVVFSYQDVVVRPALHIVAVCSLAAAAVSAWGSASSLAADMA